MQQDPHSWPELYFDANATTPVLPAAIEAARLTMQSNFGNPSSTHSSGLRAGAVLDAAHASARAVLGTSAGDIIFTSGATEGIQTSVLSALCALAEQIRVDPTAQHKTLLLYGATEHKAVPTTLAHWNQVLGLHCDILAIPVDAQGRHDLAFIASHAPRATLVCTMAVNNESGVISDLHGIRRALDDCGSTALWLVDSVQALGKIALDLEALRIDYAPFSGHKLYAPKGIGMLYVRSGAPFVPLLTGGGQETGQRGGTENMPGIAALGAVLEALRNHDAVFRSAEELHRFQTSLADALRAAFPGVLMNTPLDQSVSTTLNFSVPGLASREMMNLFDAAGMRVSAGSACNSSKVSRSFVLDAMGLGEWRSASAVRLSFGPCVLAEEISEACHRIARAGQALRAACLLGEGAAPVGGSASGLLQMKYESTNCWIIADQGECVIVDPQPALVERIAQSVLCRGLRLIAILATSLDPQIGLACRSLEAKLTPDAAPPFPLSLSLADGSSVPALRVGSLHLARSSVDEQTIFLLGMAEQGRLPAAAIRHIFVGTLLNAASAYPALQQLQTWAQPHSILLPAHDSEIELATNLATGLKNALEFARKHTLPTMSASLSADTDANTGLRPSPLPQFRAQHPQAQLIDVRETYEFEAGLALPEETKQTVVNIPLSQLAGHLPEWAKNQDQALIFICRSGQRSAQASRCLQQLGHQFVWP